MPARTITRRRLLKSVEGTPAVGGVEVSGWLQTVKIAFVALMPGRRRQQQRLPNTHITLRQ